MIITVEHCDLNTKKQQQQQQKTNRTQIQWSNVNVDKATKGMPNNEDEKKQKVKLKTKH